MARIRRRAYPRFDASPPALVESKYGRNGNARGKRNTGSKGQSSKSQQLPNKPRRG
jgi:hypothetical protein